jgi:hypothetical protein
MRTSTTLGPAVAVAMLLLAALPTGGASSTTAMRFGVDAAAIGPLAGQGAKPDYALFWVGSWTERSGWSGVGSQAKSIADQGVVPVVEWWYWGDDISPSCVSNGCTDRYQGVWKDRAHWASDAAKLADALHAALQGRRGIVVVESEFNKNGVDTWETFDGDLQAHAGIFRQHAPEVKLVLGFGNWASWNWPNFDRAAGAMDMVGFQTLRGSTHDSSSSYLGAVDAIKAATSKLHADFGKPVLLHDLALSSYPEPTWAGYQDQVVKSLFARAGELAAAGLAGVVYRTLRDDAHANTANYYGAAERSWGLEHSDGSWKPAMRDFVAGVKAVRIGAAPSGTTSTSSFSASFTPKAVGNDWWVEVAVGSSHAIAKVEASLNGGAWQDLPKDDWGTWAASLHAPGGTQVRFRARDSAGALAYSGTTTW